MKKGVLRNFTKFTGKHLCLRPATLLKRGSGTCFAVNFVKFLRTPFLQNTIGQLLLEWYYKVLQSATTSQCDVLQDTAKGFDRH